MRIEDVIKIEKNDGIATIWLDHQLEKTNIVSPALIEIFETVFNTIASDNEIKAAVLISRKKDFIAGADIKSFAIEKPGDFLPYQQKGHASLEKLEGGKKPIVAAVHGGCFGLGTELALACHAIVASNDSSTVFALPEVKIGLLPGGGGTQRLPRRVGIQAALDMMLTGKNIYAYRARKMGLVDVLTDKNKLHQAAVITAKKLLKNPSKKQPKKSLVNKLLENNPLGRSVLFSQARKMANKQSQGNYPAVPAIIECVERGFKNGIADGYAAELEHFEKLMLTPESDALRGLFFQMTDNKKNPIDNNAMKIQRLGMIGAGFMGAGIAEVSVNKGIDVLLKDINQETIQEARRSIWKGLKKKIRYKTLSKTAAETVIGRVHGQLDYDHFDTADLVIEAVLEKMDLKKQIIKEVESLGNDNLIFASNTSSLSVTEMANSANKPDQVVGMHYFSPVPKMPLLEIVKTPQTADWVLAACYDFGVRQGKTCIIVNDGPGFYVNRILAPYLNECLLMIEEGVPFDAIDKALLKKGFPVGPITLMDQVGLDIVAHSTSSSEAVVKDRDGFEISKGVVKMYEAGRRGRKNKQGFYQYSDKGKRKGVDSSAYQYFKGDGNKSLPASEIQDRALMLMLNEAVICLENDIISKPTDGDLGAVFGIGFLPFSGGPFRYIDHVGVKNIYDTMQRLTETYGPRFQPAKMLKDMAENGKTFH